MKRLLFAVTATATLFAAPALADNGQVFDWRAQMQAYPTAERIEQKRCFDGRAISGANRAGQTLYVQSRQGSVYRMSLAGGCDALAAAQAIRLSADGSDVVCATSRAQMTVQTSAGAQQCAITNVRALTSREASTLAASAQR